MIVLLDRGWSYFKHQLPWDGNRRVMGRETKKVVDQFREAAKDYGVSGRVSCGKRDSTKWTGVMRTRSKLHEYNFDMQNHNVAHGVNRLRQHKRKKSISTGEFLSEEQKTEHIHCADAFRNATSDTSRGRAILPHQPNKKDVDSTYRSGADYGVYEYLQGVCLSKFWL